MLNRRTTVDLVVAHLSTAILAGELRPGMPLREIDLSETLGVSRNTLREAFRGLSSNGLVEYEAHRGASVALPRVEDIRDIFRVRRTIELDAVDALGVSRGDELAAMAEAADDVGRFVQSGEAVALVDADMQFHCALVAALRSERISKFYAESFNELRLALLLTDRATPPDASMTLDHLRLVEALRKGDRSECRRELADHLNRSERLIIGAIEGSEEINARSR